MTRTCSRLYSSLRRDARLDQVAIAHARAMQQARRLGHDVGDGNPASRLEAADLVARVSGENVAYAGSVARAHRTLWESPSHRANLLHERFDAVGIGLVKEADGRVWVCQSFAGGLAR